jgi:SAM-dependent methyltransferase
VPIPEVSQQFDEIAVQYDETRDPMDAEAVATLVRLLADRGISSLLEVGVGTGRIAAPLTRAGLNVTGLDGSSQMLARARTKGDFPLVRGDAYRLPFADAAFDGALFVHVLHLLDRPRDALAEAIRAAPRGAMAILRTPSPDDADRERGENDARRIVHRELRAAGYPAPEPSGGPPVRERKILAEFPPDRLDPIEDREVTEGIDRQLRMLERGASRHTLHVPPEVLARAVEVARRELGDRTVTFRHRESLATWTAVPEAAARGPG